MGRVINRSLLNTRRLSVNLVTYPEGHHVRRHNDPMGGGSYYKLNFVLIKPAEGGVFELRSHNVDFGLMLTEKLGSDEISSEQAISQGRETKLTSKGSESLMFI
mgnify:CR=1 FL=1